MHAFLNSRRTDGVGGRLHLGSSSSWCFAWESTGDLRLFVGNTSSKGFYTGGLLGVLRGSKVLQSLLRGPKKLPTPFAILLSIQSSHPKQRGNTHPRLYDMHTLVSCERMFDVFGVLRSVNACSVELCVRRLCSPYDGVSLMIVRSGVVFNT